MKKRLIFISYLFLLVMVAFIAACSSTPKQESRGEVTRKTTVTTERPVNEEKRTTTTTTTERPVTEEKRTTSTTTIESN
jgi:hypothetical protein